MAVALATLRANCYTTMYDHLQTGNYAISTNNIHPNYNDQQLMSEGLPQVIIKLKAEVKKLSADGSIREAIIDYMIEVLHNSAQNTRTSMDEIGNKIRSGKTVFTAVDLYPREEGEDSPEESYYSSNRTIHRGVLHFTFVYIGVE